MGVIRMFAAATVGLVSTVAMAADPDQAIRQSLQKIQPDMPIEAVAESPMPGCIRFSWKAGGSCMPVPTVSLSFRVISTSSRMGRRST